MRADSPLASGNVDWTGENPGILLKEAPDGPFSAMALFFRIAWSPAGQGQVLLLYARPDGPGGPTQRDNVLISDNPALADYLKANFIALLPGFGNLSAFPNLPHLQALRVRTDGDPMGQRYTETVVAPDIVVELVWERLDPPRALELPPELTGTKVHSMATLLVPARDAQIIVNGRRLPGQPARRMQAGVETTTAFLYFSETWVRPHDRNV